jgi:preprotein translocase subunit SecA
MLSLGMEEDDESKRITKRIAAAQKAVETQHFEARKHLLEYDDVNNQQRQAVYGMRRGLLEGADQKEHVLDMVRGIAQAFIDMRAPDNQHPDTWDLTTLRTDILSQFGYKVDPSELAGMTRLEIEDFICDRLAQKYQEKEDLVGADIMRQTERMVMLQVIDDQWKDHLLSMDHLKEGIALRGYGQKDPLVEYKKESFILFQAMMDRIEDETIRYLFFLQIAREGPGQASPVLPFPTDEDEEEESQEPQPDLSQQHRAAAQATIHDFTKNLERNKEQELAPI